MVTPQQRFPDLLHAHLDQAGNQHLDRPSRPRADDDLWALDTGLRPARSYRSMHLSLVGPPRSNTGQSPKRVLRSNSRRGWSEGRSARRESRRGGCDGWAKSQDRPNAWADGGVRRLGSRRLRPRSVYRYPRRCSGAPSVIAADAGVTPSWPHDPLAVEDSRGEAVVGSVMWPVTDESARQRSRPPAADDQAVVASNGETTAQVGSPVVGRGDRG